MKRSKERRSLQQRQHASLALYVIQPWYLYSRCFHSSLGRNYPRQSIYDQTKRTPHSIERTANKDGNILNHCSTECNRHHKLISIMQSLKMIVKIKGFQ